MSNKFETLFTGLSGVTLIELAGTLPTAEEITHMGQLCIQIVIGIVTLIRMLKGVPQPPKSDKKEDTPES